MKFLEIYINSIISSALLPRVGSTLDSVCRQHSTAALLKGAHSLVGRQRWTSWCWQVEHRGCTPSCLGERGGSWEKLPSKDS